MRLKCEREALLSAIAFVGGHVSRGDAIPILAHTKLEAAGDHLVVIGTNLDRAAQTSLTAECEAPGTLCLPIAPLKKALTLSNGAEAAISVERARATLRIGHSRFAMDGLPGSDFPDMPMLHGDAAASFTLPADEVVSLNRKVGFCPSTDINRQYMHGTLWHVAGGKMLFRCSDGTVMSQIVCDAPPGLDRMAAIVPPIDLPRWTEDIEISVSDRFIRLRHGADSVASKLIEGTYPEFQQILDSLAVKHNTVLRFDLRELRAVVERVSINAEGNHRGHSILFEGADGKCTLSTATARGDAEDQIAYEGGAFTVALASRLLRPILASLDGDTVELHHSDPSTPVIIRTPLEPGRTLLAYTYRDPRLSVAAAPSGLEAAS